MQVALRSREPTGYKKNIDHTRCQAPQQAAVSTAVFSAWCLFGVWHHPASSFVALLLRGMNQMAAMFGRLSEASNCASPVNLAMRSRSCAKDSGGTLMATSRFCLVSVAR